MIRLASTFLLPTLAMADTALPALPNGGAIHFLEARFETPSDGPLARYRYVAPDLPDVALDLVPDATGALCRDHALPDALAQNTGTAQIIISLSDRSLEFGTTAPEAVQYFEVYRIENETCIWEVF